MLASPMQQEAHVVNGRLEDRLLFSAASAIMQPPPDWDIEVDAEIADEYGTSLCLQLPHSAQTLSATPAINSDLAQALENLFDRSGLNLGAEFSDDTSHLDEVPNAALSSVKAEVIHAILAADSTLTFSDATGTFSRMVRTSSPETEPAMLAITGPPVFDDFAICESLYESVLLSFLLASLSLTEPPGPKSKIM